MRLHAVIMRRLRMRMREPFTTSYGVEQDKDVVVLEVHADDGAVGFSECVAMREPLYNEETAETAWIMLRNYFIPAVLPLEFDTVSDLGRISSALARFKGNRMAKAAIEMAVWDAYAAATQRPLVDLLGGTRSEIPVGISVGIQPTIRTLLERVEQYLNQGYARIKVKIRPGWDIEPLRAIRQAFGEIPLMADANSAYRLVDAEHLRRLDELGLMMIEQPFAPDDLVDHAALQSQLATPICLDESIRHAEDARKAIQLGACRVINLKLGRVGGFREAMATHDLCRAAGVELWCGGMLETGIGRLHNIAITSLPGFTLPGDTAPSRRYFEEDVIDPPVEFSRPGYLAVERLAGVQARVCRERLRRWTVAEEVFKRR